MRTLVIDTCIALAALLVFCVGYILWDREGDYYKVDVATLGPGPQNDLIRYGHALVTETPRYIGGGAQDPSQVYAGNNLSCQNCHLKAGRQPFAAPFVSTAATFPMLVDNKVLTLPERINACVELGLNGRALPDDSREMAALIAYIEFLGKDTPEGVRLPGSGLLPIKLPTQPPDARRGATIYATHCASCHGADGQGQPKVSPDVGYYVPPLWGEGSFNAAAGMGRIAYAASFIRANMPKGTVYTAPVLSVQEAWDVAAYVISNPHPIAPPEPEAEPGAEELDLEVEAANP